MAGWWEEPAVLAAGRGRGQVTIITLNIGTGRPLQTV